MGIKKKESIGLSLELLNNCIKELLRMKTTFTFANKSEND